MHFRVRANLYFCRVNALQLPYTIVLGSGSPRRKQLLAGLGIPFDVRIKPVSEDFPADMPHAEVPVFLSQQKSAVFDADFLQTPDLLLITADTIVSIGEAILNKPENREEALSMLARLNGNQHTVYTGVTLRTANHQISFVEETRVYFASLEESWLVYYVDSCQPYDKAGSYGVQEWLGYAAIHRIEGCYYNVMGLPVSRLFSELCKFGVKNH